MRKDQGEEVLMSGVAACMHSKTDGERGAAVCRLSLGLLAGLRDPVFQWSR